jgi:serine/threonine-protein kinase
MAVALAPGTEFAGHRIEALLGQGGMGLVYRATQLALERPVALKLIVPEYASDVLFRERFKREARLAARIDHPNALPVFEAGEAEGMLFLTMRYVDGTDLEAMIAGEGALSPELAAAIIGQVGAALDAAHAVGLVHRDVKPANVLVERGPGGEAHAWLMDFGLTKQVGSASGLTKTSMWVGTVDYAAPEQIQSMTVDARADVYALGCVLFQALTGQVPFPREREVSKIMAHATEQPPSVTDVLPAAPAAFDEIIQRAMAKDPAERQQSAGELGRAALEAAGVTGGVKLEGRFLAVAPAGRDADRGAPTVG